MNGCDHLDGVLDASRRKAAGSDLDARPGTPPLPDLGPTHWKALASPIRVELLLLAAAIEPCSIADLARLSGRRNTGLYRHVAILVESELLLPCGKRPGSRRPEQLHRVNEHFISMRDRSGREPGATDRFRNAQAAVWRAIDRGLSDRPAGDGGTATANHPDTALHEVTWLDEERRGEVQRLFDRLRTICDEGRRHRRGELCQLDLLVWRRAASDGGDA